jgi:hypothetical protein
MNASTLPRVLRGRNQATDPAMRPTQADLFELFSVEEYLRYRLTGTRYGVAALKNPSARVQKFLDEFGGKSMAAYCSFVFGLDLDGLRFHRAEFGVGSTDEPYLRDLLGDLWGYLDYSHTEYFDKAAEFVADLTPFLGGAVSASRLDLSPDGKIIVGTDYEGADYEGPDLSNAGVAPGFGLLDCGKRWGRVYFDWKLCECEFRPCVHFPCWPAGGPSDERVLAIQRKQDLFKSSSRLAGMCELPDPNHPVFVRRDVGELWRRMTTPETPGPPIVVTNQAAASKPDKPNAARVRALQNVRRWLYSSLVGRDELGLGSAHSLLLAFRQVLVGEWDAWASGSHGVALWWAVGRDGGARYSVCAYAFPGAKTVNV